ncbi:MAG: hydroxymethylbilane synthase [Lachnospiraceae bacterium]|nr:hydroxymethylbilane synthase [Lachnospiraceae bacterium]
MTETRKIVIGSRESALALVQSEMVRDYITRPETGVTAEILKMKTTGDRILDRRLDQIGGKGLFVKELDLALRERRSDISVHSLKDMPMEVPEDLPLLAFSKREDPRDVLVLPEGVTVPEGADPWSCVDLSKPVGSSSMRRVIQLEKLFPEARFESVRGNLQTRLRKLDEGQYGALILAAAGLKRMGLAHRISRYFSPDEVIPSAGQGILAVQGRAGEDHAYLDGFEDVPSALAAVCERAFVRELDGGCTSPIAAHAVWAEGTLTLRGLFCDEKTMVWDTCKAERPCADRTEAEAIGKACARELKARVEAAEKASK